MNTRLREPNLTDATGIALLDRQMREDDVEISGTPVTPFDIEKTIPELINGIQQGSLMWVTLEVDGKYAGHAQTCFRYSGLASHVSEFSIGILRQYKGKGFGCMLYRGFEEKCRTINISILTAMTKQSNIVIERFLRSEGFEEAGRIFGAVRRSDGITEDMMIWQKNISPT